MLVKNYAYVYRNCSVTERVLDSYEQEELQRLNDELQERKRLLEERLSELNKRLQELEDLKTRLELERRQLAAYCQSMELHVIRLEGELRLAMAEADRLQICALASADDSSDPAEVADDDSMSSSGSDSDMSFESDWDSPLEEDADDTSLLSAEPQENAVNDAYQVPDIP